MSGALQHEQSVALRLTSRRARLAARGAGPDSLRHLRIIGVALPVAFVVLVEIIRFTVVEADISHARGHLILGAITIMSIVAFASAMFFLIGRANRLIIRQNRELAAVNAVSTAVRGDLGFEQIVDAALDSVLTSSGAVEVSITSTAPGSDPATAETVTWRRRVADAPDGVRIIDIPLSTATAILGRIRLHLPADRAEPDRLASDTLRNIGQQVGSAIQHARLVADLQRRKREGHALYDVLLRISNRAAPVDTLVAVVGYARDMLGADEARMCLNDSTSRLVQLDAALAGDAAVPDGPVCLLPVPEAVPVHAAHGRSCPLRSSPEYDSTLTAALDGPDASFGKLWIGRRDGEAFTERDRGYLETLSEIAVIAIANARMREAERQGAIIAERERIAREMHDSLAQVLGVTHLRLRALAGHVAADDSHVAGELSDLAGICHEAYQDVREAILGLRESSRTDRALVDTLAAYLEKFSRQSGIRATLDCPAGTSLALSPRCEVQVIRVIQEALTNVRKHSGATAVVVRITTAASGTVFEVEDNGHGFDPDTATSGRDRFGLLSMRERVGLLNGGLTVDSTPGRGTRVTARLPGACQVPLSTPTPEVATA